MQIPYRLIITYWAGAPRRQEEIEGRKALCLFAAVEVGERLRHRARYAVGNRTLVDLVAVPEEVSVE